MDERDRTLNDIRTAGGWDGVPNSKLAERVASLVGGYEKMAAEVVELGEKLDSASRVIAESDDFHNAVAEAFDAGPDVGFEGLLDAIRKVRELSIAEGARAGILDRQLESLRQGVYANLGFRGELSMDDEQLLSHVGASRSSATRTVEAQSEVGRLSGIVTDLRARLVSSEGEVGNLRNLLGTRDSEIEQHKSRAAELEVNVDTLATMTKILHRERDSARREVSSATNLHTKLCHLIGGEFAKGDPTLRTGEEVYGQLSALIEGLRGSLRDEESRNKYLSDRSRATSNRVQAFRKWAIGIAGGSSDSGVDGDDELMRFVGDTVAEGDEFRQAVALLAGSDWNPKTMTDGELLTLVREAMSRVAPAPGASGELEMIRSKYIALLERIVGPEGQGGS